MSDKKVVKVIETAGGPVEVRDAEVFAVNRYWYNSNVAVKLEVIDLCRDCHTQFYYETATWAWAGDHDSVCAYCGTSDNEYLKRVNQSGRQLTIINADPKPLRAIQGRMPLPPQ